MGGVITDTDPTRRTRHARQVFLFQLVACLVGYASHHVSIALGVASVGWAWLALEAHLEIRSINSRTFLELPEPRTIPRSGRLQ